MKFQYHCFKLLKSFFSYLPLYQVFLKIKDSCHVLRKYLIDYFRWNWGGRSRKSLVLRPFGVLGNVDQQWQSPTWSDFATVGQHSTFSLI